MAFQFEMITDPDRVRVTEGGQWVATFTLSCYTVTTAGPQRTFSGESPGITVTHGIWVRAAPGAVDEQIDTRWLQLALDANQLGVPDALALAMQYVRDAPPVLLGDLQIAGDASYGPLQSDGTRQEGSDFNDYLGLRWLYPGDRPDDPEERQFRCLDCSGFVRMVWGYRHHLPDSGYSDSVPLARGLSDGSQLPRRAIEMYDNATGLVLVEDTDQQVTNFDQLDIGDLVFFDGSTDDGDAIDHVGMYLGLDALGNRRFVSSRKTDNGPTFSDRGGASVLNGDGHYARAFRAVRRL